MASVFAEAHYIYIHDYKASTLFCYSTTHSSMFSSQTGKLGVVQPVRMESLEKEEEMDGVNRRTAFLS